ncbi:S8 family serine peptidase [Pseudomonas alloputida]|uniref:S8 family serine peptidase n=1 Tax=Pseudomonas TaxID=286 RepID=UPI003EEE0A79
MNLDLDFVYYRNFRFDGRFHIRCIGNDLDKVARIRYELERIEPGGAVHLTGMSTHSQAFSGVLADHGCPATLITKVQVGTYRISPRVVLLDAHALARGLPPGARGVIDLEPLSLVITEQDLKRKLLDNVPLSSSLHRRRRALDEMLPDRPVNDLFVQLGEHAGTSGVGKSLPPLLVEFTPGGFDQLHADLDPRSHSKLVRLWPKLGSVIKLQPLLDPHEQDDPRVQVLAQYYLIKQPQSMLNDTFLALSRSLAALPYVKTLQFQTEHPDPHPFLLLAAGALATLLTGAAVVAGNRAYENAQPTPDFEPQQHYLDAPGGRWQGLNVQQAWNLRVRGRGARIHFSDGGLFPNHEDLRKNPALKIVALGPNDDPKHGTASAGILLAADNALGVTGISHESELFIYHNRAQDGAGRLRTLKDLLRQVEPGDIVGINRQTANVRDLYTFLPSVHEQNWWEAIRALTERGAVVLVAACNGSNRTDEKLGSVAGQGVDLSQWRNFNDRGDAGAILVGACQSWDGKPHAYSNHHYRYRMLNAWGDSVTTLSYGDLQDRPGDDRDYTDNYGGTSSATPMVTGALALIQSYAMEQHHLYLNAEQMHLLVMASGYDDASESGSEVLPMGARPNVQGALLLLDQVLGSGRFLSARDAL